MANPNRDLSPCVIDWDSGSTVWEKTFGGVLFNYEELRAAIKRDQAGETDVDEVTIGVVNPLLTVPLSEEEVANLEIVFANASAGAANLKVSNPVGVPVFALSKQIIVKPIINGDISVTEDEWLYIHRAYPRVTMENPYDNSGQRVTNVIFKGFPDDQSPRIGEMWRYGAADE